MKNDVFDCARFFLSKESMPALKLRRLVYYAYAWALAILNDDENHLENKLFDEKFEAWASGPVSPKLYFNNMLCGWNIPMEPFNDSIYNADEIDVLKQTWDVYGKYTAWELSDLSMRDEPWINARRVREITGSGDVFIDDKQIFRFYSEQGSDHMTKNEAKKKWLMRYKNAKLLSRDLDDELRTLRLSKMYPSHIVTGMPLGGSGCNDLSTYAAAVDNLESRILRNRYKLTKTYTEISNAIDSLEDERQQRVMRFRYLRCMKWDDVAAKIKKNVRQAYRIHGHALDSITIPREGVNGP